MIPKRIHYCWFGRNPKPELAEKCIKSWRKFCPDYEIIEWNEDNFDLAAAPLYVRQAYEARKWAFVTDYVRLWAMTRYGGIYMDTDVEVVKPLDRFLHHQAFSGFEDAVHIPTGIMACEKGFPLFEEFLQYYQDKSFLNPDGTPDCTTNVVIMTDMCLARGLKQDNTFQVVDGFALYPKDVFCPVEMSTGLAKKTGNTAAIHWFAGSWVDAAELEEREAGRRERRQRERRQRMQRLVHDTVHLPNLVLRKLMGDGKYEALKKKLRG